MNFKLTSRFSAYSNAIITLVMTIFALSQGEATVFYMIFLFWCQEVIRVIFTAGFFWFSNRKKETSTLKSVGFSPMIFGNFFLLFVYLIFIVLLFGFILNWNNRELLTINLTTMLFRNVFFNLNLFFFAVMLFFQLKNEQQFIQKEDLLFFSPNQLILHISIILGALIQFFIVKKYPEIFTPENFWGSVAVLAPFLLLRLFIPGNLAETEASSKKK